jgi:transcription termination factor Rho
MFESSILKGMKLSELQEIAKLAKTIKFAGVKKDALIDMILANQSKEVSTPKVESKESTDSEIKPKRARIISNSSENSNNQPNLFGDDKKEDAPKPVKELKFKNPKFAKKEQLEPKLASVETNSPVIEAD